MLFGYARVSTADQNPDHQIDALTRAGVAANDIYVDHASGAKASHPQLDIVLRTLRDGDTLKITRLDRLGRSVLHLVTLGAELRERGVGLHVTEQGIDTTTAEGRAMFGMLSVLAELQRELIVANTRDGLAAARARGRTGGRPPKLNPDQIALAQQLYDAGERTVQEIADLLNVPRTTIYGHLNGARNGNRPGVRVQRTQQSPTLISAKGMNERSRELFSGPQIALERVIGAHGAPERAHPGPDPTVDVLQREHPAGPAGLRSPQDAPTARR